jgi:predicted TIM-barrel fold metal-dependent hydrolase
MTRPIIDSHTHLTSFDAIERFNHIRATCDLYGMTVACIPYMGPHINVLGLLAKALRPADTWTLGGLDHAAPGHEESGLDFAAQARRLRELGADGVKMIEGKPGARRETGLALDDPRYHGFYRYLEDQGMPLLFHVADPETFWDADKAPEFARKADWLYLDPSFPSKEQLYTESTHVVELFARLKVIFAHFYFLSADIERAAAFLDTHPSVCFDITPGSEMYYDFSRDPVAWREFFIRYQDRILFGTDNTAHTEELAQWSVQNITRIREFLETNSAFSGPGLALPAETLDCIYGGNFERLFGREPRAVDTSALVAQSAIALEHARAGAGDQRSVEQLELIMRQLSSLV